MRVCIIGGGVAGLQSAKILEDIGIQCVIFEKRSELGGVWCLCRNFEPQPKLLDSTPTPTFCPGLAGTRVFIFNLHMKSTPFPTTRSTQVLRSIPVAPQCTNICSITPRSINFDGCAGWGQP